MAIPIEVCEQRDPKGLYKKVGRRGARWAQRVGARRALVMRGGRRAGLPSALLSQCNKQCWCCMATATLPPPPLPQARAGLIKNFTGIDDPCELLPLVPPAALPSSIPPAPAASVLLA